jgi:Protein of unknown function (DUF3303)
MKFISTYAIRPGCHQEAATRFLSGQAAPPQGVTLLGRWHSTDGSGGTSLFESDDAAALYAFTAQWFDVLETHTHLVVEDDVAGPALAKRYGAPK